MAMLAGWTRLIPPLCSRTQNFKRNENDLKLKQEIELIKQQLNVKRTRLNVNELLITA